MSEPLVICQHVSKTFSVPTTPHHSLRGRILHPFDRTTHRQFDALDDVSFEVPRGEFFGIVGRNGSGKSTLLKVLAGIYPPDTGSVRLNGTLAPFIELGVGFNFELSGRDNVFINGALLGLTKREIEGRYDAIVDFAELDGFMDMKLSNFSSGMQVRLAFAVAIQASADVLLVDEVLAVGDERFQRKCFDVFQERKDRGETVVFVSHDMGAVGEFCDRAVLLEHGQVRMIGPARDVGHRYRMLNLGQDDDDQVGKEFDSGWIQDVWIEDTRGEPAATVQQREPLVLRVRIAVREALESPSCGLIITNSRGSDVFVMATGYANVETPPATAGSVLELRATVQNHLAQGSYWVTATLSDGDHGLPIDIRHHVAMFDVQAQTNTGAMVDLPYSLELTQATRAHPT
jgi:ABC-type polysaccharide/polyol phosphate transport system ATPase subunit